MHERATIEIQNKYWLKRMHECAHTVPYISDQAKYAHGASTKIICYFIKEFINRKTQRV